MNDIVQYKDKMSGKYVMFDCKKKVIYCYKITQEPFWAVPIIHQRVAYQDYPELTALAAWIIRV